MLTRKRVLCAMYVHCGRAGAAACVHAYGVLCGMVQRMRYGLCTQYYNGRGCRQGFRMSVVERERGGRTWLTVAR